MDGTQIFNLVTGLLSGLALFMFGMNVMSDIMTQVAGGRLSSYIEKITGNRIAGWAFGTGLSVFVQSSVTTVLVVGLVNSGIMTVAQSVGVMIGANLGTSATAWLLSLNSLGGSFLLQLLKPSSFAPFLGVGGVVFLMFAKDDKKRSVGTIIVGFSVMMIGMNLMSESVSPLQNVPAFNKMMFSFSNPFIGVLVGIACTLMIQSSAAAIGILQALAISVGVTYGMAIPIVCGAQLGTCLTAILASLGSGRKGKRAALIHLFYNLIRNSLFLVIFYSLNAVLHFSILHAQPGAVGIAAFHTLINLAGSALFLPLGNLMVKLVHRVIPFNAAEREEEANTLTILNPLFLSNPAFALEQVKTASEMLADVVQDYLDAYLDMIDQNTPERPDKVRMLGEKADRYAAQIRKYCIRIAEQKLYDKNAARLSFLNSSVNNFAEISYKISEMEKGFIDYRKTGQNFSPEAAKDLNIFGNAIQEILETTVHEYSVGSTRLAGTVQIYREIITDMLGKVSRRNARRLHSGQCTPDGSRVFSEICAGYERIIDRCDSIARHILIDAGGTAAAAPAEGQYERIMALFEDKFSELQ